MTNKIYTLCLSIILTSSISYASKEVKIDISKQKLYCIENGEVVMESRISSGKNGYRTPNGQFHILEKKKKHNSNKYDNASMPNMMRLTNYGVAIHAGSTAKAYASHGCVRLPHAASSKVFNWATIGTPVRIYGAKANTINRSKEVKKRVTKRRYTSNKKRYRNNNMASNNTNEVKYEYKDQSQAIMQPVMYQAQ